MKKSLRPHTSHKGLKLEKDLRPTTAPQVFQNSLNRIQTENEINGIFNNEKRQNSALPRMISSPTLKGIKYDNGSYGSSYVKQERDDEESFENGLSQKNEHEKNQINSQTSLSDRGFKAYRTGTPKRTGSETLSQSPSMLNVTAEDVSLNNGISIYL